jgi:hypothetical protein
MLDRSIRHPHVERGLDAYPTPPAAVEALLRVERLPHCIWEPAAGRGAIVNVLRDRGHAVIASDIVDYGFPLHFVGDFLKQTKAPIGTEATVTNPAYRIAVPFVERAIALSPLVILLLRWGFYEGHRKRRIQVLEHAGLARIHLFRRRLEGMHRDGWNGPKARPWQSLAWWVWERGHRDGVVVDRISWEDEPSA